MVEIGGLCKAENGRSNITAPGGLRKFSGEVFRRTMKKKRTIKLLKKKNKIGFENVMPIRKRQLAKSVTRGSVFARSEQRRRCPQPKSCNSKFWGDGGVGGGKNGERPAIEGSWSYGLADRSWGVARKRRELKWLRISA